MDHADKLTRFYSAFHMVSHVRDNVVTFRHTRTSASQAEHISHIVLLNQDDLAACVQKSSIILM